MVELRTEYKDLSIPYRGSILGIERMLTHCLYNVGQACRRSDRTLIDVWRVGGHAFFTWS